MSAVWQSVRRGLRPRTRLRELRERRFERRLASTRILSCFAQGYPQARFLEIGANDGEQHDHIRNFVRRLAWRGLMVEPVPFVFERLRRNYGDLDHVALANIAISDRDGELPFFHLAHSEDPEQEGLPPWYDGIGSLSLDALLEHAREIPDIERRIVRTTVPCLTLRSLCDRHDVQHLDLLVIDAEGHDWQILRQLDLTDLRPRLLIYEHVHLSPADRSAAEEHVWRAGYEVKSEHFDTFCLDVTVDDRLTDAWRTIEPALPAVSASTAQARR